MGDLSSVAPPECGRRLIPKLVDEIARTDPQRTFIAVPKSSRLEDGFVDINYDLFARAINRCSWWMDSNLSKSKESKTLLYFGPLDYRYFIILIAAAKTGHVVGCLPCRQIVYVLITTFRHFSAPTVTAWRLMCRS